MTMDQFVWLAKDPWAGIYAMVSATFAQNAFRFRADDGSETGATWLAAENTNLTGFDISGNTRLRVRIAMQETAGGSSNNVDITLQFRVNGGAWTEVNGSNAVVNYVTSNFVANGVQTTDQLTTPTGTFLPGEFISQDESEARTSFNGNDHTEIEYSLLLIHADINDEDVIDFRTLANGDTLNSYSVVPSVTVSVETPAPSVHEGPAAPLTVQVGNQNLGLKDSSGSATGTLNVSSSVVGNKFVSTEVSELTFVNVESSGIAIKPPTNVNANEIADNTVRLTWDAVSGAQNGYAVERDEEIIAQDVMDTEYIDEDVPLGERIYRVGTLA